MRRLSPRFDALAIKKPAHLRAKESQVRRKHTAQAHTGVPTLSTCLFFHPDCNRWSWNFTRSTAEAGRGLRERPRYRQ